MSNQGGIDIGSTFALAPAKEIEAARRGIPDVCGSLSAMGTTVNIRIMGEVGGHLNDAIACAFREITLIEEMMTTHDETSMLSAVNRAAGNDMIEVDRRVIEVARAAIESAAKSRGLFDPTILPLLKAWGFREEAKDIPKSVEKAIERVGYNQISIEGEKLGLQRAGAGLDFGGIAKGYAVDRAVAILRGWGIRNAIVEAGGDLYVLGKPDDAAGWKIGVKNPIGPGLCAVFELADRAVATSGNYATRRVENARAMTDTFDP
ncbi:FAD:protein FMN transferase, partial [Candidatus Sumerlaeota bacterium]|nr:FAD:protein FMN transferase [Candidatus Sumerlaeota bacterium]